MKMWVCKIEELLKVNMKKSIIIIRMMMKNRKGEDLCEGRYQLWLFVAGSDEREREIMELKRGSRDCF